MFFLKLIKGLGIFSIFRGVLHTLMHLISNSCPYTSSVNNSTIPLDPDPLTLDQENTNHRHNLKKWITTEIFKLTPKEGHSNSVNQ